MPECGIQSLILFKRRDILEMSPIWRRAARMISWTAEAYPVSGIGASAQILDAPQMGIGKRNGGYDQYL